MAVKLIEVQWFGVHAPDVVHVYLFALKHIPHVFVHDSKTVKIQLESTVALPGPNVVIYKTVICKKPGPSCPKLTMLLVYLLLNFDH